MFRLTLSIWWVNDEYYPVRLRLSGDGVTFLSVRMSWVEQGLPLRLKLRFRVRLTEAEPARGGQPPGIYDQSMTNATHLATY